MAGDQESTSACCSRWKARMTRLRSPSKSPGRSNAAAVQVAGADGGKHGQGGCWDSTRLGDRHAGHLL